MYESTKKYQINQNIRKMMETKLGIKPELTNIDAEVLMNKIIKKGEFDKEKKFTDNEKTKLSLLLNDIIPNKHNYKELLNISVFVKHIYNKDEIINYVRNQIITRYKPGFVIHNIRAYNDNTILFLTLFHDYFETIKGVIINPTFIGDVIKIYPEVKFDKETTEILDDTTYVFNKLIETLKNKYQDKIQIFLNGFYVFATQDEKIIEEFRNDYFKGLKIEVIPKFYFGFK